jgi:hypothetical protein
MEEALAARLAADAGIAEIVGDRVSMAARVEGTALPALVFSLISQGQEWTLAGPDGLDRPRVRFDCLAATDIAALLLRRAVVAALTPAADVDGLRFHPAMVVASRTIAEPQLDGGQDLFHEQIELQFYYEEL